LIARKPIRVMIVDDSALVRQVITQAISRDPSIEVVATAQDPIFALEKLKTLWPDVIVLDIEMPRMDGLTFLKKIMAERPTPVIICSSLAESGAQVTMEALAAGAVSIITKPKIDLKAFLQDSANDIVANIKAAARANMKAVRRIATTAGLPLLNRQKLSADVMLPSAHTGARMYGTTDKLIAIGTSTGGTQALEAVLTKLPATTTGIVIVQHMPERFTAMFAERLNGLCQIEVREGKDGDRVRPGLALMGALPGGKHMMVKRSGAQYYVEVKDGPLVNAWSSAQAIGRRAVPLAVAPFAGSDRRPKRLLGIIMTGMGDDGARGLKDDARYRLADHRRGLNRPA
jgi:two-component system chemotaxis response regulator CheB